LVWSNVFFPILYSDPDGQFFNFRRKKKTNENVWNQEFYKLRYELKEYTSIQKKLSELEIALEKSNNDKKDKQFLKTGLLVENVMLIREKEWNEKAYERKIPN
jgi:hypothetical protein